MAGILDEIMYNLAILGLSKNKYRYKINMRGGSL